ncbi:MAG: NAD-glutamate dehydrogenase, partial [Alphaproteobacteria bacterium]|nr:NAD-glutamate dehydrogenase [Alphaproteobacteria bacterium]
FPTKMQEGFGPRLARHRLSRELVATSVTNSMVNRVGSTFVNRIAEETGDAPAEVARAYVLTRDAFRVRELWDAIEALDNQVPAASQVAMKCEIGRLVERGTLWFLYNLGRPIDIASGVASFGAGIAELGQRIPAILPEGTRAQAEARAERFAKGQVPRDLAERIGALEALASAPDIVQAARGRDIAIDEVGRIYFEVGDRLGLDWLHTSALGIAAETHWQRLALTAIVNDLFGRQRALTTVIIDGADNRFDPASGRMALNGAVDHWSERNRATVERTKGLLDDLRSAGAFDLAMLALANRQIRGLVARPPAASP